MKKAFRIIGTFALCIIGACMIIFLLGWIVDINAQGKLKKEGDKALTLLQQYQTQPEANAWDYYRLVIEDMKTRELSYEVTQYINQEIEYSDKINEELTAYPDVIELVKRGNAQPECWIPIPYEQGAAADIRVDPIQWAGHHRAETGRGGAARSGPLFPDLRRLSAHECPRERPDRAAEADRRPFP